MKKLIRCLLVALTLVSAAGLSACVMFPIGADFKPTTWDKTVPADNKEQK